MSSSPATGPNAGGGARERSRGPTRADRRAPDRPASPGRPDVAGRIHPNPRREPTPGADTAPPLRLAGTDASAAPHSTAAQAAPQAPVADATDPRWVLAVRTAELLEGAILAPEKRQRLIRMGRVMGLTVFDCNLVIAVVQDQARRGHAPAHCPTAGAAQLAMVPAPRYGGILARLRQRPALLIASIVVTMIALELAALRWLL